LPIIASSDDRHDHAPALLATAGVLVEV